MNDNFPPGMSQRDWAHVTGEDEDDVDEFDPSEDDGGYSQSDDY